MIASLAPLMRRRRSNSNVTASSEEFWNSSPYGQLYLSFRRRNVPHMAVI